MRSLCVILLLIGFAELPVVGGAGPSGDPFAFFRPSVMTSQADRQRLEKGDSLARIVGAQGRAIAIFSATPLDITADRFVVWVEHIAALKRSQYVEQIGRFSNPPRLEDLKTLTLDADDIDDLAQCRPGQCGLKLADAEITELQRSLRTAPGDRSRVVQEAFRGLVFARVQLYVAQGLQALADYDERGTRVSLQASFSRLLHQSVFLGQQMPALAVFLDRWPNAPLSQVDSFFYWSKERLVRKSIISVTQVSLVRGDGVSRPEVLVVGKQLFATHYVDGSLSVGALMSDPRTTRRYLAYLNRSDVDALDGFWGRILRRVLEHRVRAEAPGLLQMMRRRLESGDPPE